MPIRYKTYTECANSMLITVVAIAILLTAMLMAGCAPQPRVVEVEVTSAPEINVVEVTATPVPAPAGSGGLIAFLSDRAARNYELYIMNADGTGPRLLATAGDGFCAGPSWAPDGQRIAYTKVVPDERGILDNHGPFEIWVTTLDGDEGVLLSADITGEILALPWPTPTWSPDGTRLAFIAARETDTGDTLSTIYVVAADGGGLEWSYSLPWLAFDVFWSPAGDALLLVGYDEENGPSAHMLSIADQELIEIHQNAQAADWSPDGSEIVVSSVQPPDVIVLEPGGESRVVTRLEGRFPLVVRWSSDGENILVGTSHSSNLMKITALYLVSVNTGEFVTIAEYNDKYIYQPNWSPEGDRLLYTTTDLSRRRQGDILHADLWVYDLTSGEIQQLTSGEFHDGMGVWSPDSASTLLVAPASSTPNASLSLVKSTQFFAPASTFQIKLGDLDDDGDLDAVFSNMGSNDSQVWLNDGSGHFDAGQRLTREGHGVGMEDLDGDGDLDLFITCANYGRRSTIYLNDGGVQGGMPGNFQDTDQDLGDYELSGNAVKLHDVDGDGDMDAVVVYYQVPDKIYLNDGAGNFTDSGKTCPKNSVLGDLDSDGDVDVFAKDLGRGYKAMLNDGAGNFTTHWQMEDSTVLHGDTALGDLDADGDLDVVIPNGDHDASHPTRVFMNDGTGQFTDSDQELALTKWASVALGDLNGDGYLDAFITNFGLPDQVWLNDGTGYFIGTGVELGGDATTRGVALGDLDADGDIDAFVADFGGGSNHIWFVETGTDPD